jgi:hypothetical protein
MRFRKRVRVFPGLTLNFSGSGISTTLGVPGLSVNLGRQGAFLNTGLPGTGLYNRQRIGGGSRTRGSARGAAGGRASAHGSGRGTDGGGASGRGHAGLRSGSGRGPSGWNGGAASHAAKTAEDYLSDPRYEGRRIQSAEVPELRSAELEPLREQLQTAYMERRELVNLHSLAVKSQERYRNQRTWARWLLLGWILPFFNRRVDDAAKDIAELEQQIADCAVPVDVRQSEELAEKYNILWTKYNMLCSSAAIWDVTGHVDLDTSVSRSPQQTHTFREPVTWSQAELRILHCQHRAMLLQNANGEDILIYPGFALLFNEDREFALIDLSQLELQHDSVRFIEEGSVPADAQVVDHTWTRVNKDGSPDRRFRDNTRLPICRYGRLTWRSLGGLHEAYLFSNAEKAAEFASAFSAYRAALHPGSLKGGA